ncbi:glycosyltransferase family 2 protein [Priestia aryabhattai]|uniref:glycosyltransferase family 2 protein n=1 Tax=Priestia aryabhattai TaxID=412384 RepID=UPI002E1C28FD|nr:glycosyltransferase family 2 protein [Priestia aryabhattai]MED4261168.1 glycosyltransferase family 2 protein [Priestia aryabhattai]
MKKIYIILPVHNRKEVTKRFLKCLKEQTYKNFHLILIDDGSTDGTSEMVKNSIKEVTIIKGNGNLWWGGSLQKGYEWVKENRINDEDILLIINDDTEFNKDFLEKGLLLLNQDPETLVLSTSIGKQTQRIVSGGVNVIWRNLSFKDTLINNDVDCIPTRGLFMYVKDFLNIGQFYPKLLPHYLSDYEYTIRAKRKGYRLKVEKELKLLVDENETGYHDAILENDYKSFIKKYFSKKNPGNPFTWTFFILLAAPFKWKIPNLFRVWGTAFLKIFARKIFINMKYKQR